MRGVAPGCGFSFSGCSGNLTAGKYNDGSLANRPLLADRLYEAMVEAWASTERHPLKQADFRSTTLRLEPRGESGFTLAELERRVVTDQKTPPGRTPRERLKGTA